VGGIVGIALIAMAGLLLMRRRKQNAAVQDGGLPPYLTARPGYLSEMDGAVVYKHELPGDEAAAEFQAEIPSDYGATEAKPGIQGRQQHFELPGSTPHGPTGPERL
jgi:hypothetical protein